MSNDSATERSERLEQLCVDVWSTLQDADGSRGGMQEAIDTAQDQIEQEIPDVAEQAEEEESDADESDDE
ncbi:MAG: hypothetical protein ACREBC_30195 [Pyrinomonadaceae bacterium]